MGRLTACGLEEGWLTAFTEDERAYMYSKFAKVGHEFFVEGRASGPSGMGVLPLGTAMLSHISTKKDTPLAARIISKMGEVAGSAKTVLDVHFFYMSAIKTYYKMRDDGPEYQEQAAEYCRRQIALAPKAARAFKREFKDSTLPSHTGYTQLAIILEKAGRLDETIALCEEAKRRGWGDPSPGNLTGWDKRIDKCKKKLAKAAKSASVAPPVQSEPPASHISFECPSCKEVLRIPVQYLGMAGKCKRCGSRISIPQGLTDSEK